MIADHSDRSLAELWRLDERVAVVTGAARGIGERIVRRLVEAGASVVAGDIDTDGLAALAAEFGERVVPVALDVADPAAIESAGQAAIDTFGRLDIWVNNAGVSWATGSPLDVDPSFIDTMFAINTRGCYLGAREGARRMGDNGGVVVNLASTTGFRGSVGTSVYVASKHAVVGLTKALALELGPRGIRVLGVAPTVIDTPGVRHELAALEAAGTDVRARMANNPLGRAGVPDDVARAVVFAASDMAAFMTGSTLAVDAGRLA